MADKKPLEGNHGKVPNFSRKRANTAESSSTQTPLSPRPQPPLIDTEIRKKRSAIRITTSNIQPTGPREAPPSKLTDNYQHKRPERLDTLNIGSPKGARSPLGSPGYEEAKTRSHDTKVDDLIESQADSAINERRRAASQEHRIQNWIKEKEVAKQAWDQLAERLAEAKLNSDTFSTDGIPDTNDGYRELLPLKVIREAEKSRKVSSGKQRVQDFRRQNNEYIELQVIPEADESKKIVSGKQGVQDHNKQNDESIGAWGRIAERVAKAQRDSDEFSTDRIPDTSEDFIELQASSAADGQKKATSEDFRIQGWHEKIDKSIEASKSAEASRVKKLLELAAVKPDKVARKNVSKVVDTQEQYPGDWMEEQARIVQPAEAVSSQGPESPLNPTPLNQPTLEKKSSKTGGTTYSLFPTEPKLSASRSYQNLMDARAKNAPRKVGRGRTHSVSSTKANPARSRSPHRVGDPTIGECERTAREYLESRGRRERENTDDDARSRWSRSPSDQCLPGCSCS